MVPINPPAEQLGQNNAILWGRGKQHHVREFPGPLSIKWVVHGSVEWRTARQRFTLTRASGEYLLLNRAQPYSITIEALRPVETFCVFFKNGFVEDAWRSAITPPAKLLDDPVEATANVTFVEMARPRDSLISPLLARLHQHPLEEQIFDQLAEALLWLRPEYERMLARLPASKPATRVEVAKRLQVARDFLEASVEEASVEQPVHLHNLARHAGMSPFHLQRSFKSLFGETPRDYLSRRRMETAAGLLASTDFPVTEICFRCGFESQGSFATTFRARFHASPREYREKFASRKKS